MSKKLTVPEILKAYKAAEQFETDEKFAEALGVSKQVLSHWTIGRHSPTIEWLQAMAIVKRGKWQGDMAVDLLKARGSEIPCICLDVLGDNGVCPRHGVSSSTTVRLQKKGHFVGAGIHAYDEKDRKKLLKAVKVHGEKEKPLACDAGGEG